MTESGRSINLSPRYRIESRLRRKRARVWAVSLGVYVLGAAAIAFSLNVAWQRAEQAVADRLSRLQEQLAVQNEKVALIQPRITDAALQLQASRAVAEQPDWSLLLNLLGHTRGSEIVLQRCALFPVRPEVVATQAVESEAKTSASGVAGKKPSELKPNELDYRLEISGLGLTQQDVLQYLIRMEQTGLFQRVKLLDASASPYGSKRVVAFRLECYIRNAPVSQVVSAPANRSEP